MSRPTRFEDGKTIKATPVPLPDKIDVLDKGYVRLVDHMGEDLRVVNAARVSYDKASVEWSEKDAKLLGFLLREGHTSPLRHSALTFEVYAPLMVARQWWKYAVASTHVDEQNGWNESSRRYVTETPEFYVPAKDEWRSAPENKKQGSGATIPATYPTKEKGGYAFPDWGLGGSPNNFGETWTQRLEEFISLGESWYEAAMLAGVCAEQARLFLPAYGLYVRWYWTVSLSGVVHFLNQRLEHGAQKEIQDYAAAVKDLTSIHFPNTIKEALNGQAPSL